MQMTVLELPDLGVHKLEVSSKTYHHRVLHLMNDEERYSSISATVNASIWGTIRQHAAHWMRSSPAGLFYFIGSLDEHENLDLSPMVSAAPGSRYRAVELYDDEHVAHYLMSELMRHQFPSEGPAHQPFFLLQYHVGEDAASMEAFFHKIDPVRLWYVYCDHAASGELMLIGEAFGSITLFRDEGLDLRVIERL
jgi:hypothetical protein